MEQRQLRLGDVLDDYCPRERRLTNHVIVAMVQDEIKHTRCKTCDAEHPYKGGKAPARRRKSEAPGALYQAVLSTKPETADEHEAGNGVRGELPAAPAPVETPIDEPAPPHDEGPVHRPLIRATLPRPEGLPAGRPVPEFTIRNPAGRNGNFRDARGARGLRVGHTGGAGHRPRQKPFAAAPRQHGFSRPEHRGGSSRPQMSARPSRRGPAHHGKKRSK